MISIFSKIGLHALFLGTPPAFSPAAVETDVVAADNSLLLGFDVIDLEMITPDTAYNFEEELRPVAIKFFMLSIGAFRRGNQQFATPMLLFK